jgi:transposase-like protein
VSTITTKPRKLNPATAKVIVTAVRAGAHRETAARLAGIDQSTLWRWLQQGKEDLEAKRQTACRRLHEQVEEGEASFTLRALHQIQMSAAAGDPKSAMWLLERRDPARWGRSDRLSLEARAEVEHTHRHVISEELTGGKAPIELDSRARRAAAELLQQAADKAREPDVVDAEVVESES